MEEGKKKCSKCNEVKLLVFFPPFGAVCKYCKNKKEQERRDKIKKETGFSMYFFNTLKYGEDWKKQQIIKKKNYLKANPQKRSYSKEQKEQWNKNRLIRRKSTKETVISKICTKCNINKDIQEFKSKQGRVCFSCQRETKRKNKSKYNPDSSKNKYIIHKNFILARSAKIKKKNSNDLLDPYVIKQIRQQTGLSAKEIKLDKDLIDAKRQLMKLKRKINDKK